MKLKKLVEYIDNPPVYTGFKKIIDNWFIIEKPWSCKSIKERRLWRAKQKELYPVRWFIQDTIPEWCDHAFIWPIQWFCKDLYWGFMHRYIPKHQYNIIKPKTLKPGYYDPLTLILHTNFHILSEFVEGERNHQTVDWKNSNKEHSIAWYEMNSLYDWWTIEYPTREDNLPDLHVNVPDDWPNMWQFDDDYRGTPEYKQWKVQCDIHNKVEIQFAKDDQENLIRLMKVREYMWT